MLPVSCQYAVFIMALEPLACAICSNGDIHRVNIHGHDFKLNMYADNILLTSQVSP